MTPPSSIEEVAKRVRGRRVKHEHRRLTTRRPTCDGSHQLAITLTMPGYGICPGCRKALAVLRDGTMRRHEAPA